MKLVIFHYHLWPGGVTEVIRLSLRAVLSYSKEFDSIELVVGNERNLSNVIKKMENEVGVPIRSFCYQEFAYASESQLPADHFSDDEWLSFREKLYGLHGGSDSFWWIHNHSLGKSLFFSQFLIECVEKKEQASLFQIHDFCEEGRHANRVLLAPLLDRLYPTGKKIRYACINLRDVQILREAFEPSHQSGLSEVNRGVHYLPNPYFGSSEPLLSKDSLEALRERVVEEYSLKRERDIWLYPVRGIRRKNVLEMGFLNQLQDSPSNFLPTLPANSAPEMAYSQTVETLFEEGYLEGVFQIGKDFDERLGVSFTLLFELADLLVSPSLKEGFGFLFITALEYNKPLLAHKISVLDDFSELYRDHPHHFYNEVWVPLTEKEYEVLEKDSFLRFQKITTEDPKELEKNFKKQVRKEGEGEALVPFSLFPVEEQARLIRRLKNDSNFSQLSREKNSLLLEIVQELNSAKKGEREEGKRDLLEERFGAKSFGQKFEEIVRSEGSSCQKASVHRRLCEIFRERTEVSFLF